MIEGRVERAGQRDHTGITVEVQGTPFLTSTQADGGYTLRLPARADAYTLDLRFAGHASQQVEVIADAPGETFEAPPVSLDAQPGTLSGEVAVDRLVLAELVGEIAVSLSREGEEEQFNETLSPEGTFTREVSAGNWRVRVRLEGFEDAEAVAKVAPGGDAHVGRLLLVAKEATLTGQVRLRGAPEDGHGGTRVRSQNTGIEGETAADGTFSMVLTAQAHTIRVVVPEGYALPEAARESEIELAPGATVSLGEDIWAEPLRTATVTGALTSPLGVDDWVARSVVRMTGAGVERIANLVDEAGQGRFEVASLEPGRYVLDVQVRGHQAQSSVLEVPAEGLALPPIALEPIPLRFEGEVADPGGEPIADVVVRARRGEQAADSAITDANGRFSLSLNAELHVLSLSHSDFLPVTDANVVVAEGGLALEAPLVLQPLPRSTLIGRLDSPLDLEDWNGRAVLTLTSPSITRLTVPQPDGAFRFEDVPPGAYELAVSARGHTHRPQEVELAQGERDLGVIVLTPEFVDPDAIALTGRVRLDDVPEDGDHSGVIVRGRVGANPVFTTSTDPEGLFVAFVSGDDHLISFSKPGYGRDEGALDWVVEEEHFLWGDPPEVVGDNHPFATLRSLETATLRGTLRSPLGVEDWNDRALLVLADQGNQRTALVVNNEDGTGGFEFNALRPGPYTLSAQARGHEPLLRRVEVLDDMPPIELAFVPNPELYSARITAPGGEPIEGVVVRARIGQNIIDTAISDGAGNFTLSLVPESHALTFTHPAYESPAPRDLDWGEAGFAPREGEAPYVLQPVAGRITVTVDVQPDWLPDHQRVVRVQILGEGVARTEERVGHGRPVSFEGLPAGAYTVLAERGGFVPASVPVVLDEDAPNAERALAVRLQRLEGSGLDLRGVCATDENLRALEVDEEGEPAPGNLAGANLAGLKLVSAANLETCRAGDPVNAQDVDLSCLDLRGVDLAGTNLQNANLVGADLGRANLANAVLQGAALAETNLGGTSFFGADLRGARFDAREGDSECSAPVAPSFTGTDFAQADLTGAVFTAAPADYGPEDPFAHFECEDEAPETRVDLSGVDFSSATLNEAQMWGVVLGDVNLSSASMRGTDLRNAEMEGAAMVLSDLSGADLRCGALAGATMLGAVLASADLTKASLSGATFTEAVVDGTILTRADLTETRFIGVLFAGAQLSGARFQGADLRNAEFVDAVFHHGELFAEFDGAPAEEGEPLRPVRLNNANLADADLRGVSLEGASLRGADLSSANLREANLVGVDLTGAKAIGANLIDADLSAALLADLTLQGANPGRRAFYSAGTVWPDAVPIPRIQRNPCPPLNPAFPERHVPWPVEGDFVVPSQANLLHACVNLSALRLNAEQIEEDEALGIEARAATDLTNADLRGVDLRNVDLTGAILRGADLRDADLRNATLREANLQSDGERRVRLRGVGAEPADLRGANLRGVDLSGFDLSGFDLADVRMQGAILLGADLTDVTLDGGLVHGADLRTDEFAQLSVEGTIYDLDTQWPEGFDPVAEGALDKPDDYGRVPAGSFLMYSPGTPTPITLSRTFLIAKRELRQDEVHALVPGLCMLFRHGYEIERGNAPCLLIFTNALRYLNALSREEGLEECYAEIFSGPYRRGANTPADINWDGTVPNAADCEGYRLPTNAEWEYAARGGIQEATYPWPQECMLLSRPFSSPRNPDGNLFGLLDTYGGWPEWVFHTSEARFVADSLDPVAPAGGACTIRGTRAACDLNGFSTAACHLMDGTVRPVRTVPDPPARD